MPIKNTEFLFKINKNQYHKMHRLCLALLFFCTNLLAETLSGHVIAISDGDTITVLDRSNQQYKIRLSGIDAPEKKQAFGQRSKEHLSRLVYGKPVEVEWTKRDKYKRIVGKVLVAEPDCRWEDCPKSLDAGLNQVTVGLAWWYRKYSREQSLGDQGRYEIAEAEARADRAGLWTDEEPMAPWEWRHGKNR